MPIYTTTEGPIEIWAIVWKPLRKGQPTRVRLFRVNLNTDPIAAVKVKTLVRKNIVTGSYDELREANGWEISSYFKDHPELLSKGGQTITDSGCADMRITAPKELRS